MFAVFKAFSAKKFVLNTRFAVFKVKDALQGGFQYDGEFSYLAQDTLSGTNKARHRQRRDKGHRQGRA